MLIPKQMCQLLTGRLPVQLPSAYTVCYPFMEAGCAHDSLYTGEPHIVSDDIAYPRESDCDTPALELLNQTEQLVTRTDVDEVDRTEIQKHLFHVRSCGQ